MSSPLRVENQPEPARRHRPRQRRPRRQRTQRKKGGARRIVILSVLAILLVVGAIWGFRTVVFYATTRPPTTPSSTATSTPSCRASPAT